MSKKLLKKCLEKNEFGDEVIKKKLLKPKTIMFKSPDGNILIHKLNEEEIDFLFLQNLLIKECHINYNEELIFGVNCIGRHPNVNPVSGEFCMDLPIRLKSIGELIYNLQTINLVDFIPFFDIPKYFKILKKYDEYVVPYKL